MTPGSYERLQLWIEAIDHGLARQSDWVEWAQQELAGSEPAEPWVCCLAAATTAAEALRELWACVPPASEGLRPLDGLALSLGLAYARYLAGQLGLAELLREAGDAADRANADRPSCEAYFALLTLLEAEPADRDDIAADAAQLFAPARRYARDAFARIGIVV